MIIPRTLLTALGCFSLVTTALHAQVPNLLNYQGRVAVGTTNFNGAGSFKFASVNAAGSTVYWGNAADTSPADGVPDTAVALTVTKGLYSVLLGDTSVANMAAVPASVWTNADVRLRVWFNDGTTGFQLLTPDQRLAPNGYLPDGSVASGTLAANAVTSAKIASGAVTNTQLATGIDAAKITTGTFPALSGANLTSLNGGSLNLGSVTLGALAANSVDSSKIVNGTIIAADLAPGAVTSANLASGLTLGGTTIGTFSGNGAALTNLGGANITLGSIPLGALAANSVDSSNIVNGTIVANDLASNAVTSAKISNTAVTTAKLNDAAVTKAKLDLFAGGGPPINALDGGPGVSLVLYPGSSTPGNEYPPHGFGIEGNTLYSVVPQGNRFVWYGGTSEVMRLTSEGNLGIGTSAPGAKFEVSDGTVGLQIIPGYLNGVANPNAVTLEIPGDKTLGIWDGLSVSENIFVGAGKAVFGNGRLHIQSQGGASAGLYLNPFAGGGDVYVGQNMQVTGEVTCTAVNITSDRNAKEQFTPVNARAVLDKVARLPITEWQYKTQGDARHIGPMAQDFREAFALGHDEKHITSVDADGVALAAIQGLHEIVQEKEAELARLKTENRALAERLTAIERALGMPRQARAGGQEN